MQGTSGGVSGSGHGSRSARVSGVDLVGGVVSRGGGGRWRGVEGRPECKRGRELRSDLGEMGGEGGCLGKCDDQLYCSYGFLLL